jgi:phospholipase/carboxylesterase
MSLPKLDGPRLAPATGTAKLLVVLLHGYGADGRDLIDIGQTWQALLPEAAFVAPHAHEPCGMPPSGRQWFSLTLRDESERWRGCVAARPVLDAFLDQELHKYGLDDSRLVLVGFSQGTMMALHTGLRRRRAPLAIVGFSGMFISDPAAESALEETGPPPEALVHPPVLLVHGTQDNVIPVEALFASAEMLAQNEVPTEFHLSHGLPHSIDAEGLRHGGEFILAASRRQR